MSEEKSATKTVVELNDAVCIARSLLRDMQYGYSIDDLVVEADSFMRAKSFTAVEVKMSKTVKPMNETSSQNIGKYIMNIAFYSACYDLHRRLAEKVLQKCTSDEILQFLDEIKQENKARKDEISVQ